MKKRVVLKMLKITANLKMGRLETLTANQILTLRKITAKKNQWVTLIQRTDQNT